MTRTFQIGVLALQGAFREHRRSIERLGGASREVRLPRDLEGLDALVLPGGESTTIGKLLVEWKLLDPLVERGRAGWPMWGTCAGGILLSERIEERGRAMDQPRIGLVPVTAVRNAFGRQRESFESDIRVKGLDEPLRAVFIRAPLFRSDRPDVEILAEVDSEPVALRHRSFLITSFHPELTDDLRLHRLFLSMVENPRQGTPST